MNPDPKPTTPPEVPPKPTTPPYQSKSSEMVSLTIKTQSSKFELTITKNSPLSELAKTIDDLISEISKAKSLSVADLIVQKRETMPPVVTEDKVILFAKRIGVDPVKLQESELLAIKDDDVQIIKVSKLRPIEAGLLILAVKDLLFNQKPLSYEDWKELCEASGIKSQTPFYQLAINAKMANYIDKKKHQDKQMLLTGKGQELVKKALEKFLATS